MIRYIFLQTAASRLQSALDRQSTTGGKIAGNLHGCRKCNRGFRGYHPCLDMSCRRREISYRAFHHKSFQIIIQRIVSFFSPSVRSYQISSFTARLTTSATRGSNASGRILFSFSSSSGTRPAIAFAVASFISSMAARPSRKTFEDTRESNHVIYLVREVGTAGSYYFSARSFCNIRHDLRYRIGHGK